ncbi:hypothetical protein AM571_PC01607 (plasmid) [Rhizobium etli 8C-3]|uniref:Uncharacterized protein n=1 Tax=Rhizobium etli 8C-3 TaxID=538025 RepID=A0A1L5PGJ3_RHIET|nr:hypothetical protein AM571_PC01607 [Rhizobium etli 8C-3]
MGRPGFLSPVTTAGVFAFDEGAGLSGQMPRARGPERATITRMMFFIGFGSHVLSMTAEHHGAL